MTLEEAAKKFAGNHRKFESFCWWGRPDESDLWGIYHTQHRDSKILDQSNAAAIEKELEPWMDGDEGDVIPQSFNHWAVGWIEGYAVRVYRDGQITEAFQKFYELIQRMENYSVLDEEDFSNREWEAAIKNISQRGEFAKDAHESWAHDVAGWLYDYNELEMENSDGMGAYPSDEAIIEALKDMDNLNPDYEEAIA